MNSLLVVEDEASIRDSLRDYFTSRGARVVAVASAEEADAAARAEHFTAILLDVVLPGATGLDLLKTLRRRGDRTPVIVITARGAEEQRIRGLELGADDYLVKPFSVRELEARLAAILRRSGSTPSQIQIGATQVDLAGHCLVRGDTSERLTAKEAELLGYLVLHAGKTFTRHELLRAVWGHDAMPTTRTVDTHVFTLRKKLERDPEAPEHLLTVHGVGYRLTP